MRSLVLSVLCLTACATAPETPPPNAPPAAAPSAQLRTAIGTGLGCAAPLGGSVCESVVSFDTIGETSLTARETSLFEISAMTESEMSAFIRSRPAYQQYQQLFTALEAQRASGGYQFVKLVETRRETYDPARNSWCTPARSEANAHESLQLHFSNEPAPSVAGDVALSAQNVRDLAAFLRLLSQDIAFMPLLAADPALSAALNAYLSGQPICVAYAPAQGSVGRIFSGSNGQRLNSLDDTLSILPSSSDVRLNPN